MTHIQDEGWQDLAHAVVIDAVNEWRRAKFQLSKPSLASKTALEKSRQCEKFFVSPWFTMLSGLDGSAVLKKMKEGYSFA